MVTIVEDCIKIRWNFSLDNTDIAVFGVNGHLHHITGNTIDWQRYVDDAAEKGRDKFNEHISKTPFTTAVVATSCEAYHLGTDGKTLHKGSAAFLGADAWAGTDTGASLPWEVALCISIYGYDPGSFTPRAGTKRSRFYLPPMRAGVLAGPQGLLGTSTRDQMSADLDAFLNDLEGMVLGPSGQGADYFELGIISPAQGAPRPKPATFTRAKVWGFDTRLDSQRRRENKQKPPKQWKPINQEP